MSEESEALNRIADAINRLAAAKERAPMPQSGMPDLGSLLGKLKPIIEGNIVNRPPPTPSKGVSD